MILYDSPISGNCYKVRLLAAHLGLPLERRPLDVVDRSNRRDVIGELNPALRVPTLVLDDGRPLGESGAILSYLGAGTRFVPDDGYEAAQVLQWMFFEQYDVEPNIAVARFWIKYAGGAERMPKRCPRCTRAATGRSRRWSATCRDALYLVGERLEHRRHRALRLRARRGRGRLRPRSLPRRASAGSRASRPSPATSRSTPELSGGLSRRRRPPQRRDATGVELRAGETLQLRKRRLACHTGLIAATSRHGLVGVRDVQDAGLERDLSPTSPSG